MVIGISLFLFLKACLLLNSHASTFFIIDVSFFVQFISAYVSEFVTL